MHSSPFRSDSSSGTATGRRSDNCRVLLCVADTPLREHLERLTTEICAADSATSIDRAVPLLLRDNVSLVILDEQSLPSSGSAADSSLRLLRDFSNAIANNRGQTQVLVLSVSGESARLPGALRSDEMATRMTVLNPLGLSSDLWRTLISVSLQHSETLVRREAARLPNLTNSLREVLGSGASMAKLFDTVEHLAENDTPVLICGEPGTGASLIANAIHDNGPRVTQSFVRVHSRTLILESLNELLCVDSLPSEEAAITLPLNTPPHPIGGTLFLDEFDEFPVLLHKPLCRFLERQRELSEGSQGRHQATVRVVAATHLNLEIPRRQTLGLEILTRGMNAYRMIVPPLRERVEDIAPLAEQFFVRWALQVDQPQPRLTRTSLDCLKDHLWPGNVRELYTVLRNSASLATETEITADQVRPWLAKSLEIEAAEIPQLTLASMERQLIETTFTRFGGNREKTAASLDIGLRTLSGKLREYGYPPRGGPGSNLKAA